MDYHAKYKGRSFVEVGKKNPRTIEVTEDSLYHVGTIVVAGRGKGKPLSVFRKHLIDPQRWKAV